MSFINGLGLVLNMGTYYELLNKKINNIFLNSLPNNIVIKQQNKYQIFNNENEMQNYSKKNNINSGTIVKIKNIHYIWLDNKWNKLGNVNKMQNIKIYNVYQENNNIIFNFFMTFYINDIKSNINVFNLINEKNNYILFNRELNLYYGLVDVYIFDEVFFNILNININRGINYFLKILCNTYNILFVNCNSFINSLNITLNKLINTLINKWFQIENDYMNTDITQLINYISSCFSSYKYTLSNLYNKNITDSILSPNNDLKLIDKILFNRINNNKNLNTEFLEILQIINDYIYKNIDNENSENIYNYYSELTNIIKYFKYSNIRLFNNKDKFEELLNILCDGIGGIVNSALCLSLMSCGGLNSKSQIYFDFILPWKFKNV